MKPYPVTFVYSPSFFLFLYFFLNFLFLFRVYFVIVAIAIARWWCLEYTLSMRQAN